MTVQSRLHDLAHQHALPANAPAKLHDLLQLVATDPTAATTVKDPRHAVDAHIADSLTGLEIPQLRHAAQIADLGAGAGFPGLVLAIALPTARVALVESLNRKCAFLQRATDELALSNVDVVNARAEDWTAGMAKNDAITVRAVAPLNVLAEYAAPLLTDQGVLVAYKGQRDDVEERDAEAAAQELGLERREIHRVEPFPGADHRHLYVYLKVGVTPSRYPRRPGMARKRPLSAGT